MRHIFTLLTVFVFSGSLFAESAITGNVKSDKTQEALAGVNIILIGTDYGAASDENGNFRIENVPEGSYELEVSHIGFQSVTRNITLEDETRHLNFRLTPRSLISPQVIVEPTRAIQRETPVTFSNISAEELEYRDQTKDIPLMLSDLPNVKTYSESGTGIGYAFMNIRGFDQRRISVLINGVPQNDPEDHNVYWINFYDLVGSLKDIQVQRGAGAAFYGPAAIGGSVNLITQNYSREPRLKVETLYGSYNTRKLSVEGSTGLFAGNWVGYGRLTRVTTDNYRNWNWMEFWRYFGGIGYFSKDHILKIQTYGGPQEDGLAFYGIPKSYIEDRDLRKTNYSAASRDVERFNQPHYEVHHQWQMQDNLTMSNTAYYIRGYGYFDYDGSWAPPSYYRLPVENFEPQNWSDSLGAVSMASNTMIRAFVDNQQVGLLHKYQWEHRRGSLTAGVSLRGHQSLHWGRLHETNGLVFQDTLNAESYQFDLGEQFVGGDGNKYYQYNGGKVMTSIFFHENYRLTSNINVLADLQLARKQYFFWNEKYIGNEFDIPYFFLNPRFGVNVNLTSRINTYFNISRTSREPRLKNYYDAAEATQPSFWGPVVPQFEVNSDGSYDFSEPLVKPESLNDFELGVGYQTNQFRLDANVYYMDFRNEIVSNGQLDRFGQPITGNADHTRHYGVELSGRYKPMPTFRVSGNVAVSANEFVDATSFGWVSSESLNGNTIGGFPGVLANLQFFYNPGRLFASINGKYVGKQYTTNLEDLGPFVDPYHTWSTRIGYTLQASQSEFRLVLTVNNVFDALYATHGEGEDFFPAAPRNFSVGLDYSL